MKINISGNIVAIFGWAEKNKKGLPAKQNHVNP
jgi:hypothetical protein